MSEAEIIEEKMETPNPTPTENTSLPSSQTELNKILIEDSTDDESDPPNLGEENALLKLSSHSTIEFRRLKDAIEEAIFKKVKTMDNIEKPIEEEKYVCYFKNYSIDKIGKFITHGETGIAEGWSIPLYENEFQNLLGLPFHEDNALAETMRIRRPRQECFNCLATNHRVTDCPVRIDDDRIRLHRKLFNLQSFQSQEQSDLFSCRYTSDLDSKSNRGFIPGKISDQLRLALGVRPNQLPPYIYLMRELGYPIGWLIESQFKHQKLAVHDGDTQGSGDKENVKSCQDQIEYDPDRVYTFPGFNQAPPSDTVDESERYGVERYGDKFSKERFLKSLNIRKKKVVRRASTKTDTITLSDGSDVEVIEEIPMTVEKPVEGLVETSDEGEEAGKDHEFVSPRKRRKSTQILEKHGTSFTEIPGTPVVSDPSDVKEVPNWEKFSENICEHKPFGMESLNTPTGSYKNIVKLTREFKSKTDNSLNSSSQ